MNKSCYLLFLVLLASWPWFHTWAAEGSWSDYRKRFITSDGRVVDTGRGGMSHSESQGYGLLLSLRHGDRDSFESIRKWTLDNLRVRQDQLLAWSWGRRPDGSWAVLDYNNATDGDLLVSWALTEAGKRWEREDYLRQGTALADEIKRLLAVTHQGKTLLLPGYYGFTVSHGVVINPAYFVFPAFHRLTESGKGDFWTTIEKDAIDVLKESRQGAMNLPPDWILWENDRMKIDQEKSDGFGYEAIRIPLYLALANLKEQAAAFEVYLKWIDQRGYLPSFVDLTRDQVTLTEASSGFYAVMGRLAALMEHPALSEKLMEAAKRKMDIEPQDYFSYTLYLLSQPENPNE